MQMSVMAERMYSKQAEEIEEPLGINGDGSEAVSGDDSADCLNNDRELDRLCRKPFIEVRRGEAANAGGSDPKLISAKRSSPASRIFALICCALPPWQMRYMPSFVSGF